MPKTWHVALAGGAVTARKGEALVSVTRFRLLKPYDPAEFDAAAKELDRVAGELAAAARGKLTERTTTTVAGRKIRAYRYTSGPVETRVGFVLAGRREYQLLCRLPGRGSDPDGACALLFSSFSVT